MSLSIVNSILPRINERIAMLKSVCSRQTSGVLFEAHAITASILQQGEKSQQHEGQIKVGSSTTLKNK